MFLQRVLCNLVAVRYLREISRRLGKSDPIFTEGPVISSKRCWNMIIVDYIPVVIVRDTFSNHSSEVPTNSSSSLSFFCCWEVATSKLQNANVNVVAAKRNRGFLGYLGVLQLLLLVDLWQRFHGSVKEPRNDWSFPEEARNDQNWTKTMSFFSLWKKKHTKKHVFFFSKYGVILFYWIDFMINRRGELLSPSSIKSAIPPVSGLFLVV